jgi:hypothetical protein
MQKKLTITVVVLVLGLLVSCERSSNYVPPTSTLTSATSTVLPSATSTMFTTPTPIDADKDGLLSSQEQELNTSDNELDTDGDGLDDYVEVVKYHTNPILADTDADNKPDSDIDERQENVNTTLIHIWARYMGKTDKMTTLYQEVQNVVYDDGVLVKVDLVLYPNTKPLFEASMFDVEEDLASQMGQYPQSNLSIDSREQIKTIAGSGAPFERAIRLHKWFRTTFMSKEQLPQDGWRRRRSGIGIGDYEPGDFIFRQLNPDAQFSDPYTGHDDRFRYFTITTDGIKQPVDIPRFDDPDWEFIHRFWFWRLWTTEMQIRARETGDCGPTAILLASLYQSIGIPARIVFETKATNETSQHFYPEIYINGHWVSADPNEPEIGKRYHTGWVQWNNFDGAWLIENDSFTQWGFRQPGSVNVLHGQLLDDDFGIPPDSSPNIVIPSGIK